MTQKNETLRLLVALAITGSIVAGGVWWFTNRSTGKTDVSGVATQTVATGDRISRGERILLPSETQSEEANQLKQAGVNAMAGSQYPQAAAMFGAALQKAPNAPETLIYLNNARIGNRKAYTIAVSVPIKTDLAGSAEILRGVAQAQDSVNNAGGIQGVPLKVAIASDDNEPQIARQLASTFVQDSDILGVVGHYASDVSLAASSVYNDGGLVMISPISTTVKLSGAGKYIFRTVPSDYIAARALADYATRSLQQKNIAVFFNSRSGYSESLKNEFSTAVSLAGGQISNEVDFSQPDFNAEAAVKRSQQQGAKVFMLAANTGTLDQAMQVVQANQKQSVLLGGDDVYAPKTLELGKAQADGMVVAVPWHIQANAKSAFVQESQRLWKADVNWRSAISYDAIQALIGGLQKDPTRNGVQQTLSNPDFSAPGAAQPVRFLASGDRNAKIQLVKVAPGGRSGTGFDFIPIAN